MSAIAEYELVWKEASLTKDYSEVKKLQINFLFWKKYKEKKYDKLNSEIVSKFLKTKLVISESFYQKLKTNKVLIELILVLKILYKKRKENFYSSPLIISQKLNECNNLVSFV